MVNALLSLSKCVVDFVVFVEKIVDFCIKIDYN